MGPSATVVSRQVRSQGGSKGGANGRVSRLVRSQGDTKGSDVSRLVRSQGGSKGSGVSRLVRTQESFQGRCSFKTGSDATEVPRTSYVMSWSRVAPGAPVLVVQGRPTNMWICTRRLSSLVGEKEEEQEVEAGLFKDPGP